MTKVRPVESPVPVGRRTVLTFMLGMAGGGLLSRWAAAAGAQAPGKTREQPLTPAANDTSQTGERSGGNAAFPLAVSDNRRYLVDADGAPFLIHGDTAWSLIANLTEEETLRYLDDRQARGFNAVLVNLIEHEFAPDPPANASGEPPFLTPGDYTAPNERYFAHADWVLRQAAERGFLVLLTPSYCGAGGGGEGWYQEMAANGADKLRQYGAYLGRRYRGFGNILWVHGGDYDPPDKDLVRAIAEDIREHDPDALHTAHGAPETDIAAFWAGEPWLDVGNVYSYEDVYTASIEEYARSPVRPFFLMESAYENEHDSTEQSLRAQAYQALLSGAAGQVFGNNPIWHLGGPGLYPAEMTWQEALDSRGAQSMTYLRDLFLSLKWWRLKPDINNELLPEPGVISQLFSGDNHAAAARAGDGAFAIIYVKEQAELTLDLARLAGPRVEARWYDPASGAFSTVDGAPFPASGVQSFRPASENSAGYSDWVLILESRG